ncbi:putative non-specific serine/threonine protein kinase [Rosa chinensis]|uniref:Putative non-specific serine/threonine protein kinase n=1 Tax=Rosa chinensis TaxID=74649 RepID=A0A2P6QB92_ROSCH|nr:putative non-specific serine/threonine protein kinase [Rosa chinensis]
MYVLSTGIIRVVIDESGSFQVFGWNDQWVKFYSYPTGWCDPYGRCGPNTNCDPAAKDFKSACTCLPGFESKSPSLSVGEGEGEGRCIRKVGASTCQNGEGFVKVARVKLPDSSTARVNLNMSLEECKQKCLMACSCTAYTSADERGGGIGCVTWHGDLMDTSTFSDVGQNLYVRVDATSLGTFFMFIIARAKCGRLNKYGKVVNSEYLTSRLAHISVNFKGM